MCGARIIGLLYSTPRIIDLSSSCQAVHEIAILASSNALEFDLVAYDLTTFTSKVSNKTMKTFHSSRSLLTKYLGMRQLVVLLVLLATDSHKPRNSTALVCVLVHSTHYCFTTGHPTPICMEVLTSVEYIVISCRPNIAFIKGFPMIIRIQVALKIGSTVA